MAAFQFPDPAVTQTVKNPITGSTYQWKEPPGKWVVTVSIRDVGDIIWEGEEPPNPIGDYKLWYSTDTLELYFYYTDAIGTSAWIPTAKPITGLESVIAEVDAAGVDIAQAKREIIENYDDIQRLQVALNDVEDGLGAVTLQEVLDNNNVADKGATFGGKVIIEPGTEGNEAVTYGQLSTVEEELEQLAPSIERGSWTFTLNHPPGVGQYTMIKNFLDEGAQIALCDTTYSQCIIDADGDAQKLTDCNREYNACVNGVGGSIATTTEDWTLCSELVFNDIDANGVTHTWAGIDSDHYIDVFNSADVGFMVGDITMHGGGTFEFDLVSSRGIAAGLASIKVFKAQGSVDFDQYVRKTGDTMTGTLETTSQILILPGGYGARGKTNMLVVNQRNAADGSIVRIQKQSQDVFKVEHSGDTSLMNNKLVNVATPTSATDGANKQYVDEVASATPTPFTWTLEDSNTGSTSSGCMRFKDNKFIYLSQFTYEGIELLNPTDMATGANNFSSYLPSVGSGVSLARTMKIWQQSSSGAWQLKAWMIPYRYRFWYGGWVQLEYKGREGDMTPSYGSRYGLSLPDLF